MSEKKCVNIAVLTVSDTRTEEDDKSGQVLVDRIKDAGHNLAEKKIIRKDFYGNCANHILNRQKWNRQKNFSKGKSKKSY